VGFDDIVFARYVYPPLTTVAQPVAELGRRAIEVVLSLLPDGYADPDASTDRILPGRLIVRASSGARQPPAKGVGAVVEPSAVACKEYSRGKSHEPRVRLKTHNGPVR
jgi:hypothetical protein